MDKHLLLSPLYKEGKILLAFGYSLRIAKMYYKTQTPKKSQRDSIRKMLNPKMPIKCQPIVLKLALADLAETSNQNLETATTLRSDLAAVNETVAATKKILKEINNG
ncbi:MAG: hypothetical protein KA783_01905 [Chitinophagales bacterium]|nr:hypothetical protein [Chitinophagales bacterium]